MAGSVFEFEDYRAFIKNQSEINQRTRGYQSQMAKAAGCQPSFFSQAVKGQVQLTLDHAVGLTEFWELSEDESDYFILLVQLERAAGKAMRHYCQKKIKKLQNQHANLAHRLQYPLLENEQHRGIYYSHWLLPALHIATSIPKLQSPDALARHFHLDLKLVEEKLGVLLDMDLVSIQEDGRYEHSGKFIHLPRDSHHFQIHHHNWRNQAIDKSFENGTESLHYTSLFSLSKQDKSVIEELLRKTLEEVHQIVANSKEEELLCFNCDFFQF